MSLRKLFISGFFLLAVAGCQTSSKDLGTTMVTLSPTAAAAYEKYKITGSSYGFFVVSKDGRTFGSNSCQWPNCVKLEDLIRDCSASHKSKKTTCHLFARGQRVVWPGPFRGPSLENNAFLFNMTIKEIGKAGTKSIGGRATVWDDIPTISLETRYKGKRCGGEANKTTKKWTLTCLYQDNFSGTFNPGLQTLYDGEGTSKTGRTVQISIYHKPVELTLPAGKVPEILKIYNRFVASNLIADKCMNPSLEMLSDHQENFDAVAVRAYKKVRQLFPDALAHQIELRFKQSEAKLATATAKLLKTLDCRSAQIQAELETYEKQANWKPSQKYVFAAKKTYSASDYVPLNLRPMYGYVKKNATLQKIDEKFINLVLSKDLTRQTGSDASVVGAWRYFKKDDFETAMKRFNQAWLLDPYNGDIYHGYAVLAATAKDTPEQIEKYFKLGFAKSRISAAAHVDYGWFLITRERMEEAQSHLQKALEKEPKAKNARRNLAILHLYHKDYEQSCRWAKKAKAAHDQLKPGFLKKACETVNS